MPYSIHRYRNDHAVDPCLHRWCSRFVKNCTAQFQEVIDRVVLNYRLIPPDLIFRISYWRQEEQCRLYSTPYDTNVFKKYIDAAKE